MEQIAFLNHSSKDVHFLPNTWTFFFAQEDIVQQGNLQKWMAV